MSEEEITSELGLRRALNNEEQQLYSWNSDMLTMEVFGEGKLTRIVRPGGDSPIIFEFKDESALKSGFWQYLT